MLDITDDSLSLSTLPAETRLSSECYQTCCIWTADGLLSLSISALQIHQQPFTLSACGTGELENMSDVSI